MLDFYKKIQQETILERKQNYSPTECFPKKKMGKGFTYETE